MARAAAAAKGTVNGLRRSVPFCVRGVTFPKKLCYRASGWAKTASQFRRHNVSLPSRGRKKKNRRTGKREQTWEGVRLLRMRLA